MPCRDWYAVSTVCWSFFITIQRLGWRILTRQSLVDTCFRRRYRSHRCTHCIRHNVFACYPISICRSHAHRVIHISPIFPSLGRGYGAASNTGLCYRSSGYSTLMMGCILMWLGRSSSYEVGLIVLKIRKGPMYFERSFLLPLVCRNGEFVCLVERRTKASTSNSLEFRSCCTAQPG